MFPRPLLINKEVIFDNVSDNWRWWEGRTPFEQEVRSGRSCNLLWHVWRGDGVHRETKEESSQTLMVCSSGIKTHEARLEGSGDEKLSATWEVSQQPV